MVQGFDKELVNKYFMSYSAKMITIWINTAAASCTVIDLSSSMEMSNVGVPTKFVWST
jgi:hypothetical protein